MICCFDCLRMVEPYRNPYPADESKVDDQCPYCRSDLAHSRADRFMALVAASLSHASKGSLLEDVMNDATCTMREIERRVEAGKLWEVET